MYICWQGLGVFNGLGRSALYAELSLVLKIGPSNNLKGLKLSVKNSKLDLIIIYFLFSWVWICLNKYNKYKKVIKKKSTVQRTLRMSNYFLSAYFLVKFYFNPIVDVKLFDSFSDWLSGVDVYYLVLLQLQWCFSFQKNKKR